MTSKPPSVYETILSQRASGAQPTRGVLTITSGPETGCVISIGAEGATLGRSTTCTVSFADMSLSREHARVRGVDGEYFLQDLGSRNGCFINEVRVDFATALSSGDRVRLGDNTVLRFFLVDEEEERAMRESFEQARRDALAARLQDLPERDDTLRDELEAAGEFQRRALTPPTSLPGVTVDVMYRPLDVVGGDLFHVAPLAGGGARVFLADATGHGIRASLSMMLILSEYETARHDEDPARVLAALNQRFTTAHGHLGVRFTALCADLHAGRQELRLATAAHPAAWLLGAGSPLELETGGPFVGLAEGAQFPSTTSELRPGDVFLAFTDGLTEAFDAGGEAFGEARVVEACKRAPRGKWAAEVEATLDRFRGDHPLDDDAMLLAVERRRD